MSCPTDETLKALLSAALADDETVSVRTHLEHCPACQQRLNQLTDAPSLVRKPNSKAEIAVADLDPLMNRLKRLHDKPPARLHPLEQDDEEGASIWKSVALIALAALLVLAGAWAWDHYRLQRNHELATAGLTRENAKVRAVMDQLYRSTVAVLEQKDVKAIEAKRDVAIELLNYYQFQFNEAGADPSRAAESADLAFQLAMLNEIVGPDVTAMDCFRVACYRINALPIEQQLERERICAEHLADLYVKTNQWARAASALSQQLRYWQLQINRNQHDSKARRNMVALLNRLADANQRNKDLPGSADSYRSAIGILESEVQHDPNSPFLRLELATLYESLAKVLTQLKLSGEAEIVIEKAKVLRERK